jgi:hypothetical protein
LELDLKGDATGKFRTEICRSIRPAPRPLSLDRVYRLGKAHEPDMPVIGYARVSTADQNLEFTGERASCGRVRRDSVREAAVVVPVRKGGDVLMVSAHPQYRRSARHRARGQGERCVGVRRAK